MEVTYLKCKRCNKFYESDTVHYCKEDYAPNKARSLDVANRIKDIISRRIYGEPYEHDTPTLYRYYEAVLCIVKLNERIRARYPWSNAEANIIEREALRVLGEEE